MSGFPWELSRETATVEAEQHETSQDASALPPWPDPLTPEALYGPAGEFVRLVAPHTEADPAALLIQFLVAAGCCIGPGPRFMVGSDKHTPRLFAVLVGATSRGRKGTSLGWVRAVFGAADRQWDTEHVKSGLSTGEGLIWSVRDPIYKTEQIKDKNGRATGETQTVLVDPGVDDKRLLVVEGEYARVLRVAERDGNTLSAVLRLAWDTGDLRIMTRTNPATATGAHVAIVAHITADELRRRLTQTEVANGMANRFLWIATRRSKLLPDGGSLRSEDISAFSRSLSDRIARARSLGELSRSQAAAELWHEVYPVLSRDDVGGLLGAVTARAEAQVLRLSMLYALLDVSREVLPEHLAAALEVWRYAEDSAHYIFGEAFGDPIADEILQALTTVPGGLTRNEIRDLFSRNVSSGRIGAALQALARCGRATMVVERTGERGRPAERWRLGSLPHAKNDSNAETRAR